MQKSVLAYRGSHTEEDSPFHPAVAVFLRAVWDRRCTLPHTQQKHSAILHSPMGTVRLAPRRRRRRARGPATVGGKRAACGSADSRLAGAAGRGGSRPWPRAGGAGPGGARPGPRPSSAPADCWRFSGINKPFPFHSFPSRPSG